MHQNTYLALKAILSDEEKAEVIEQLRDALYCSKVCAYAQGFQLMDITSKEQGWSLEFAEIAKIWRAGCIIKHASFNQSPKPIKERMSCLTYC